LQSVLAQQPQPPSDESLRQLIEATHLARVLDSYMTAVDSGMQAGIRQALSGKQPNARQQQIIDDMRTRMIKLLRESLGWSKLEPIFMDIYRRNFTQQEVNDMLAFYRSPTGRAVVDKLPATMQQAAQAVQKMLPSFIEQMQQIERDTAEKLKAAGQS
jgi:uncharacterized protein